MKKRILAFLLTVCMVFTSTPITAMAKEAQNNEVSEISATLKDYPETAAKSCNRAQFATILWRALGSPEPEGTEAPFPDMDRDEYYYKAAIWCVENGIIPGRENGTRFSPEGFLARAEIMLIFQRMNAYVRTGAKQDDELEEYPELPFKDITESDWYYGAIYWAYMEGILTETELFRPYDLCTLSEAQEFIERFIRYVPLIGEMILNETEISLKDGDSYQLEARIAPANAEDNSVMWESSASSVAKVDQEGKVTAIGGGTAVISAKAADGSDVSASCTVTVIGPIKEPINTIILDKEELSLKVGESYHLMAQITPEEASDDEIVWASSKPSVATVNQNGKITAISQGIVTITVTAADKSDVSDSCIVTVEGPLKDYPETADKGCTRGNVAMLLWRVAGSPELDLEWLEVLQRVGLPYTDVDSNDYFYKAVAWTYFEGVMTGKSATIFAPEDTLTRAQMMSLLYSVAGYPETEYVELPFIDVEESSWYYAAVCWAYNEGIIMETEYFGWSDVCTLGATQEFLARFKGYVPLIGKITLNRTEISLEEGDSYQILAQLAPVDAVNNSVEWESSNPSVATVDQNGNVVAVKEGAATITVTATDGSDVSVSCNVRVVLKGSYVENPKESDYSYQVLEDGSVEITGYIGNDTEIAIPATIAGYDVTTIGDNAFEGQEDISSIIIPDSVTSIGILAFYGCSNLSSVNIPENVMSIGSNAFMFCSSLKYIEVSENNKEYCSVDGVLFNKSKTELITCPSGKEGIYRIPDGVINIGDSAFSDCINLSSIIIPEGVTSIGNEVFWDCNNLNSIYIPNSVTRIGDSAFYACSSLSSINLPEGVMQIEDWTFALCSSLNSINIPEKITSIGDYAFSNCNSLSSVIIPESVMSIGYSAFIGCSSLVSINIPKSVTVIGDSTFMGCSSLRSIVISEGVTSIDDGAFSACTSLSSINIPESMKNIGWGAFDDCTSLKDVYYAGNRDTWDNIEIGEYNDSLAVAIIHYNYVSQEAVDKFQDISSEEWFYEAVNYVYKNNIMTGMNETSFAPYNTLVRAQFASVLYSANNLPDITFEAKFSDVMEDDWYADAVIWANKNGIVNGYGSGAFGPGDAVTREQMAIMMYNYAAAQGYANNQRADISTFADAGLVSWYAEEAMQWAVGSGVITGKDVGTRLDPQGSASRAECAAIMQRFMVNCAK